MLLISVSNTFGQRSVMRSSFYEVSGTVLVFQIFVGFAMDLSSQAAGVEGIIAEKSVRLSHLFRMWVVHLHWEGSPCL